MSLNKVILIGNVGRDPEIRYFDNGRAIANFSLATSERGYKLANGTEVPERTEWHNIVTSRERAQFVEKYVKKGAFIYLEGKIRSRNYEDKDGIKRYITEIYADRIDFYSSISNSARAQSGDTAAETSAGATTPTDLPPTPEPADDLPF